MDKMLVMVPACSDAFMAVMILKILSSYYKKYQISHDVKRDIGNIYFI